MFWEMNRIYIHTNFVAILCDFIFVFFTVEYYYGAKVDWDFQSSDLIKNLDGTDI